MTTQETLSPADAIAALGLTVESVFVPFSQSRNKAEGSKTLNWVVTVKRNGRDVIKTDYSAGIAHCPGYKASKAPTAFQPHGYKTHDGKPYKGSTSAYRSATFGESLSQYLNAIAAAECESGVAMELNHWGSGPSNVFQPKMTRGDSGSRKAVPILPDALDVIYSLVMDSSVLDAGGFENWAADYSYDTDSRSAESTYRACLDIALKMRGAIGESGLETLRDAFQDY